MDTKPKCFATQVAVVCLNIECKYFFECTMKIAKIYDMEETEEKKDGNTISTV